MPKLTRVTILSHTDHNRRNGHMSLCFSPSKAIPQICELIRQHDMNRSKARLMYDTNLDSAELADEMFDLTNNPSRQEERELYYGRGRSMSVGDIAEIERDDPENPEYWLCDSIGWLMLDIKNSKVADY